MPLKYKKGDKVWITDIGSSVSKGKVIDVIKQDSIDWYIVRVHDIPPYINRKVEESDLLPRGRKS